MKTASSFVSSCSAKFFLFPWAFCLLSGAITFTAVQAAEEEKPISPVAIELNREIDYAQDIEPILKKNCVACHNASSLEGELNLESPALMLKGGSSGASIEPGDPEASFLYLVASRESEPLMPPLPNKMNAHKLTGEEVWKLKRWIELGAKGEASGNKKMVQWTGVAPHLQPIYSVAVFPQEDQFVVGRGNKVEVISLTDPTQKQILVDPELETLAHRDFVNAVAVHPSGQFLASAGYRCVKIWEQLPARVEQSFAAAGGISAAQSSGNQKFYALADPTGTIYYGSAQQGATWNSGQMGITALAIDDAGQKLAFTQGTELKFVDLQKPETVVVAAVDSPVHSLIYLQNQLWAGHADGSIRPWNLLDGQLQAAEGPLKKHSTPVTKLQTNPGEGSHLLSLEQNGNVILWDSAAKAPKLEWATGGDTLDFNYSPTAKKLATVHASGRVVVWDEQKKQLQEFKQALPLLVQSHQLQDKVTIDKALAANAKTLLTAAEKDLTDRKAALEKAQAAVKTAEEALAKTVAPKDEAQAALDAVKKQIAEAGEETEELKKKLAEVTKQFEEKLKPFTDAEQSVARLKKTLELEENSVKKSEMSLAEIQAQVAKTAEQVVQSEQELKLAQEELAKSPAASKGVRFINPQQLQILTAAGSLEDWNIATGQPYKVSPLPQTTAATGWLPLENQRFCVLHPAGQVQLMNFTPEWKLFSRLGPPNGQLEISVSEFADRVTALAFSPDGKLLATGGGDPSRDGELMLWDWQTSPTPRRIAEAHSDVVLSLEFSRDGSQLLSGAADKFVKIFNVESGEKTHAFEGHTEHVLGVSWTADALTVASASADKTIKIWNTLDGSQKRTISVAGKQVTSLKFIGVTDNLISSGGDKLVRMYRAGNGQNYRNLAGAENYLYSAAVTRNEGLVIGGGQAGIVRIWNGQNGQLLHSLKAE